MSSFLAPHRLTRLPLLIAITAAIVGASLSIHVVMLQVLGIPYPDTSKLGIWLRLYPLVQAVGLVGLASVTAPAMRRFPLLVRWLLLTLLFTAMNGGVRNALMAGVVTDGYVAPLAGLIQGLAGNLVLAALALVVVALVRNVALRIVAGAAIGWAVLTQVSPILGAALAPLTGWMAAQARPEVHLPPYGPDVLVPSYVLFAETVIACLIARFAATFRDAAWDPRGLIRYVLLVLSVRGTIVMMGVWSPMIGPNPAAGMLSMSQFFLQDLALAVLVQLAFTRLSARH